LNNRIHDSPNLIYSAGTQVVTLKQVQGSNGQADHVAGAVGVVIRSPLDRQHSYRVRFVDGFEAALHHDDLTPLAKYKQGVLNDANQELSTHGLFDRVIIRCVVGSRAFGLDTESSDTDRRGVYLPPANLHWSIYGVPDQLENEATQEVYWELQKFLVMALKGNPNILESLYTPLVEFASPLGKELLEIGFLIVDVIRKIPKNPNCDSLKQSLEPINKSSFAAVRIGFRFRQRSRERLGC
jgi:uncharacterized protein